MIAAIDPGASGGMAWIDSSCEVKTCSMANRGEFVGALRKEGGEIVKTDEILEPLATIYMEKVAGYYPKPKVIPDQKPEFNLQVSAFSMFNFGKSAGICIGICEAFGITPIEVMPAVWQKVLFVKKSGSRSQWKNQLKEIAQRRYPDVRVTLANADALLILSYATLITRGEIHVAP